MIANDPNDQASITWSRLYPRLEPHLKRADTAFLNRLEARFPAFFDAFLELYGSQYDFYYHLEAALVACIRAHAERDTVLRAADEKRVSEPTWFQQQTMLGGVCYVDLFAHDFAGLSERIPYFDELGVNYLHLMPLFAVPEPRNDGGYAVSSFRDVNPKLGSMAELQTLAGILRESGISLVLDFVFNHTSDEHAWAMQAKSGSRTYQQYYRMFDDRILPDQYEPHLREIFPQQAPGSFTYQADINKWVWTTFYPFQWDLNYANPDVFTAMFGEMMFLYNLGVDVLRLDAVPFVWKELGTPCENLPQVHTLIRAYNALVSIAAPGVLFKSEAIVHPRDVRSYIRPDECQLSYNPILMVALWEAAATRDTRFLTHTMKKQFPLPEGTAWINYLRSHDDIGWGFADEDAQELGINPADHRYFLNMFYTGRFPGSFAKGEPFNFNPRTMDMRISGTMASLAGLDQALESGNGSLVDRAIDRIVLLFSVVFSVGGIPLIYLGDEIGTLNDTAYSDDPLKAYDSRWLHRPAADPKRYAARLASESPEGRIYARVKHLIDLRKSELAFADGQTHFVDTGVHSVFAYTRQNHIACLANFGDVAQSIDLGLLGSSWETDPSRDLISNDEVHGHLGLPPLQIAWLKR